MRGVEQIPWLYDAFMALTEPFGLMRWRRMRHPMTPRPMAANSKPNPPNASGNRKRWLKLSMMASSGVQGS